MGEDLDSQVIAEQEVSTSPSHEHLGEVTSRPRPSLGYAVPAELATRRGRQGDLTTQLIDLPPLQSAAAVRMLSRRVGNRELARVFREGERRRILARTVDPKLEQALTAIRDFETASKQLTPLPTLDARIENVRHELSGIDLTDPDNSRRVVEEITRTFATNERGKVIAEILSAADKPRAVQPGGSGLAPPAGGRPDDQMWERQKQFFEVPRRGPYGLPGPGVVAPFFAQGALDLSVAFDRALAGAGAFAAGILSGASSVITAEDMQRISRQLATSSILNMIFTPVFLAGTSVGILEDVVDAVKGIWNLITDFSGFVDQIANFFAVLFGPSGAAVAKRLGEEIGKEYATKVSTLAKGNPFEFTYGIGRMVGPTIVYIILTFVGVPELLVSTFLARLVEILGPWLERFPRLLAIAERVAAKVGKRAATMAELEADLDRAFAATFTEPAPAPGPGAPTVIPPEVRAGFRATEIAPLRRLLGRSLTSQEVADLGRVWTSVANPGEAGSLTLDNSRRLFDNQRRRFWSAVRQDAAAKKLFEDAGFGFSGDATTAPTKTLADGSTMQATIDHAVERQTDPTRALDPANLRVVTRRENTVMLRQLHAQDPFLAPPAARANP
jgi:hypothetical protein